MSTITTETPNELLEYADTPSISATDYGTFVRALVYTLEKGLPVEIIDKATNNMIKAHIIFCSISYKQGEEGNLDTIIIDYRINEEEMKKITFEGIGKNYIVKDRKSGTRTFYRYYLNLDSKSYRFTFNRRISKAN